MKISLKQLRVFACTAKHGNITLAAKETAVSQSAASMSLAQLESLLGQQLFRRVGKQLVLNDLGMKLLPKANAILDGVQSLEFSISSQSQLTGSLHIGASTTIANNILPGVLSDFTKRYPGINIKLTALNTEDCIEKLLDYHVDIALVEGLSLSDKVEFEPWLVDQLTLFCHPRHPLAQKAKIKVKELSSYPWVLREASSGTRQAFEAALISSPITIDNLITINSSQSIKNFVRESKVHLSCLSESVIASDVKQKKLVKIQVESLCLKRYFYHVKYKEKTYSELAKLFIDVIKNM